MQINKKTTRKSVANAANEYKNRMFGLDYGGFALRLVHHFEPRGRREPGQLLEDHKESGA